MIRKGLWHNLAALKSIFDEPWLLGGDFNNILQMEEREGGSVLSNGDHPQFEEFLRKSWDTLLDVHTNIRAFQFKKSRVQWAQFGDRNTSYFHNRAMQQRRTNFVEALRDSDGAWCSDR
ncbi:hypothetical protein V6N13_043481 [Hibiscus sabdariffa]